MTTLRRLQHTTLVMLASITALGQATTIPTTSPVENHGEYSINLENLSIQLTNNIRSKPGILPFSTVATGVSNIYSNHGGSTGQQIAGVTLYQPYNATPNNMAARLGFTSTDCPNSVNGYYLTNFYLLTPDGSSHPVVGTTEVDVPSTSGIICRNNVQTYSSHTTDGTGLQVSGTVLKSPTTGAYYFTYSIIFPNGYVLQGATLTDLSGNTITAAEPNGIPSYYVDAMGVNALALLSPGSNTGFSWTDANGATQKFNTISATYNFQTTYGCALPSIDADGTTYISPVTTINFPDGSTESLAYEQTPGKGSSYSTGRLTKITLRTGGTISFGYSGAFNCTMLASPTMTRMTSDGTWTYTIALLSSSGVPYGSTTTVTDPAGNVTIYTFNGAPTLWNTFVPVLAEVQIYNGASTLVSTSVLCYNGNTICTGSSAPLISLPITKTSETTTLAGMTTSTNVTKYFDTTYNALLTEVDKSGFAGTPTTNDYIVYGSYSGSSCVPVTGMIAAVCHRYSKYNGNQVSNFLYSNNAAGEPTETSEWTGTQWLTSSATYNANGSLATSTDVKGVVTSYAFGDCNGQLMTQKAVGPVITSAVWDCNGGVMTSSTDANSKVTTYSSVLNGVADPFWRVQTTTDPNLTTTTVTYTPTQTTVTRTFGSSTETLISTVDGYGRSIRSQMKHGSSYDTVTTKYGFASGTGATISVSVPCGPIALNADCTTGFTVDTYDGGGRLVTSVDGGGATKTLTYSKNDVTSTLSPAPGSEHNKVTTTEFDGLVEPTSSCGILTTGGTSCGQAVSGSGYVTTYGYSSSSTNITATSVRGSQTRSTVKDDLGRTTATTDPERGTSSYVYDYYSPGTGCGYTTLPGQLIVVILPSTNEKCFNYDSYGRMTDMGENKASDGTAVCTRFRFDTSTSNNIFTAPGTISNGVGRVVEAETDDCTATSFPPPAGHWFSDEWFSYDNLGNVTDVWEATAHSGGYYHSTATYFANGKISSLGIPGVGTINYTLDGDGKWASAKMGTLNLISSVTYVPTGVGTVNIGSGTDKDVYNYSPSTGLMTSYQLTGGSKSDSGTLTWNANRTLGSLQIVDGWNTADNETCTYIYDDLSRLTSDQCGSVWAQTYGYDMYDNMNQFGNDPFTFTYNPANNHYSTTGVTYDADGDLTYDGVNAYTYNGQDKLQNAVVSGTTCVNNDWSVCIVYDAFGRGVEYESLGSYYPMVYGPAGKMGQMLSPQTLNYAYVPLPGGSSAMYWTGTFYYTHTDWLGSGRLNTTIPTSGNGVLYYDRQFSPFGEVYGNSGSAYGLNFTGDTQDAFGSLYDTDNRELNQLQGRWLTPDPARFGWNLYAYPTNPNSETDPTGLRPMSCLEDVQGDCMHQLTSTDPMAGACNATIDYGSAPCSLLGSGEANIVCPNGNCSVFNQTFTGKYGGSFSLLAGTNGLVWMNNYNGMDLSDAGAAEAGLDNPVSLQSLPDNPNDLRLITKTDYCKGGDRTIEYWLEHPKSGALATGSWTVTEQIQSDVKTNSGGPGEFPNKYTDLLSQFGSPNPYKAIQTFTMSVNGRTFSALVNIGGQDFGKLGLWISHNPLRNGQPSPHPCSQ